MSDAQDQAEALDHDKLDVGGDFERTDLGPEQFGSDELDTDYPPDRPQGVDRMAMTPAEEAFPESVAERARREVPDPLADELDRAADATDDEAGNGPANETDDDLRLRLEELPDEAAWSEDDLNRPIELVAPEDLDDDPHFEDEESDLIAEDVPAAGQLSAEEAAVHATGSAPFRSSDSYLSDSDEADDSDG